MSPLDPARRLGIISAYDSYVTSSEGGRLPIRAAQLKRLRELGYDEVWLQNWLVHDPSRLGLGEVTVLAQEVSSSTAGSLDILAANGDIYYSVEVQLGEVDASHGFRVFDYWAKNRLRYPDKTHVAVLIAESAAGRFQHALAALAEYVPLVVIELRTFVGEAEALVLPQTVYVNESLDIGAAAAGSARTEADWREELTEEAWRFQEEFVSWVRSALGEVRVDYSPKTYIGIRRGRRVWAPLWPRMNGANTYLPDPDRVKGEQPSLAFEWFRERLAAVGLEPTWAPTYNAGANPISIRLRRDDLAKPEVQELLRASFEALEDSVSPWSERNLVAGEPKGPAAADVAAAGVDVRVQGAE